MRANIENQPLTVGDVEAGSVITVNVPVHENKTYMVGPKEEYQNRRKSMNLANGDIEVIGNWFPVDKIYKTNIILIQTPLEPES